MVKLCDRLGHVLHNSILDLVEGNDSVFPCTYFIHPQLLNFPLNYDGLSESQTNI